MTKPTPPAGHWQVHGHINASGYSRAAGGEVYGPLPRKRWVGPHSSKKPNKLSYRWRYTASGTADEYNEKLASRYVQYLAARDGLKIPSLKSRVVWSGFYSAWRTRNVRSYSGASNQPVYCRRVQAIEWGHEEERYNERKDGRRGAWTHNEFVPEFRIDIPHWDFEHPEPVEEAC